MSHAARRDGFINENLRVLIVGLPGSAYRPGQMTYNLGAVLTLDEVYVLSRATGTRADGKFGAQIAR